MVNTVRFLGAKPRVWCALASLSILACGIPARAGWIQGPVGLNGYNDTAITYDSVRGRIVLFGGEVGGHESNETWEFDGANWTLGPPAPSGLTARDGVALAFDKGRHRVVLFGGHSIGNIYHNDTWEYDGLAWTPGPAAPPGLTVRHRAAMEYDVATAHVVLFGGADDLANPSVYYNDTWLYDGTAWTPGPTAPATLTPRYRHRMAYDAGRGRVVLFGGYSPTTGASSYKNDTWEYDGTSWIAGPAAPAGLLGRRSHGLVYDGPRGRMVMFGGYRFSSTTGGYYLNDTWEYNGAAWTPGATPPAGLTPRPGHAMAFDETRRRAVVFGGRGSNDVWEHTGTGWVAGAAPPNGIPSRLLHAGAYDSASGRMVVFGGFGGQFRNDTQLYDGTSWLPGAAAPGGLAARSRHAMVYDSTRQRVILFGGSQDIGAATTYYNDTWEWNGTGWTPGPAAPGGLIARRAMIMAFDSATGKVVMFGGSAPSGGGGGAVYLNDTWLYDGAGWTSGPSAPAGLTPRRSSSMAYDATRNRMVLFGGYYYDSVNVNDVYYGDVWEYDGTAWAAAATPPAGVGKRSEAAMTFDAGRNKVILYGGHGHDFSNTFAYFDDTWEYDGTWTSIGTSPVALGYRDVPALVYDSARSRTVLFHAATTWELDVTKPDYLCGAGLGVTNPNRVAIFSAGGGPTTVDFLAYGAGKWGTTIVSGDVDGATYDEIVTGPGPGDVFGPQVRAFQRDGTSVNKINFFAYGTLKFGVNVGAGNVDADPFEELLSGAGPGGVFGPHVRGFNFDATTLTPIAKLSYFAYGTLKYGVNVASGQVDSDAFGEILTGPGPGAIFGPQMRGFNFDGAALTSISKINFNAFSTSQYGANVASGDVDRDNFEEILSAVGPGPGLSSELRGHNYDGTSVTALVGYDITPFPTHYGARVGAGDVAGGTAEELMAGGGRDAAADSTVKTYGYSGGTLTSVTPPFVAFIGTTYGVNTVGGNFGL